MFVERKFRTTITNVTTDVQLIIKPMTTNNTVKFVELDFFDSYAIADDDFYNYLTVAEFVEHYYANDDCEDNDAGLIDWVAIECANYKANVKAGHIQSI